MSTAEFTRAEGQLPLDGERRHVDHYETGASSVAGVRVTETQRSPGWLSVGDSDLCPEHAATGGAS